MTCNDRKNRGLNQRILLINHEKNEASYNFEVLGTRGVSYQLNLDSERYSCNCPDYKFHHKTCKHLYFLFNKILKFDDPEKWISLISIDGKNKLDTIETRLLSSTNKLLSFKDISIRNTECGICLCDFEVNEKIHKCEICENGIHSICWLKYSNYMQNKNTCIYCRY